MKQTPTSLLLEVRLGEPLAEYVRRMRSDERTWDYIARSLRRATDGKVKFSVESLRTWFADDSELAA